MDAKISLTACCVFALLNNFTKALSLNKGESFFIKVTSLLIDHNQLPLHIRSDSASKARSSFEALAISSRLFAVDSTEEG
ncbi:hypothetical protein KKG31_00855 [Patescibacteria group bacterium]|nr:hypothetical protein [Patescibacteria group bacterium]